MSLAFQVAAAAQAPTGENLAPVLWSDHYIELMSDESLTLTAELPAHSTQRPAIVVSGWNIPSVTLHPAVETQTASK